MRALARWRPWHVIAVCVAWVLLAPLLTGAGIVLAGTVLDAASGRRDVSLTIALTGWSVVTGLALPPALLAAAWLRARSRIPAGDAGSDALRPHLALVALLVRDYDEAIAYFTERLGFRLLEDTPLSATKRWVRVAPPSATGTALLLARAATPEQLAAVGRQGGARVFLFLHTDDFQRDHAAFRARGVAFVEAPREEPYGTVAVFEDLYGNRWDLVQPRGDTAPRRPA